MNTGSLLYKKNPLMKLYSQEDCLGKFKGLFLYKAFCEITRD